MTRMKLVITGAGGLLGSALLKSAKEYEVYSFYNQHPPASGSLVHVDLQNQDRLTDALRRVKPDVIVHAAALTDIDRCERERDLATAVNYEATNTIAKCARDLGAYLVYVSTDYVFDGEKGMYREDDEPAPINFYGQTKLMGEQAVGELLSACLITRASVIYGSTPSSGKVNFALWVLGALKEGKQVAVPADQFVSPTLNTNLGEMIMECVEKRSTGVLHLSGASRLSRFDFARKLCKTWSLNQSLINPVEMRKMNWLASRPKDSSLDVTKAGAFLRTGPTSIKESLHTLKEEFDSREGTG